MRMKSLRHFYSLFFWLFIYSVAMACLESVVVVYFRALYFPDGFSLTLIQIPIRIIHIEIFREAATVIMLMSVSVLCGHNRVQRVSVFIFCFGIWDIFYYIWLKILLNWPAGLMDADILFLIPTLWIGPVLAPLLIAIGLTGTGILLFIREMHDKPIRKTWIGWILILGGCGLMFKSFLVDSPHSFETLSQFRYPWELFILGMVAAIGGVGLMLMPKSKSQIPNKTD
jgi:hypothetical protein